MFLLQYSVQKSISEYLCVDSLTFSSIPLCALVNQHFSLLASKFPATKFLKSIATSCIPNYPDKNLPTIFVYFEGDLKGQVVGPFEFGGMNLTVEGRGVALNGRSLICFVTLISKVIWLFYCYTCGTCK